MVPARFSLLIESLRPRQWTKNLILFAGLIFSQNLGDTGLFLRAAAGAGVFSLLSGCIYLFNDIVDVDLDRQHPYKRFRPVASGRLTERAAGVQAVLIAVLALACAWLLGREFLLTALAFLLLNVVYSLLLKRYVIIDVMGIAASFVVRAVASVTVLAAVIPGLALSKWLILCTFFLSLFLGFSKRRSEFVRVLATGNHTRPSLHRYNEQLLNLSIGLSMGLTLMAYVMYTLWPHTVSHFGTNRLVFTSPFVFLGLGRYLVLVFREGQGGRPHEILLGDATIKIAVLGWIVSVCAIIGFSD